jgi:hypothetical protein
LAGTAILLSLLMVSALHGAATRRAINIGPLAQLQGDVGADGSIPVQRWIGINSLGHVAYSTAPPDHADSRAKLWVSSAAYGLSDDGLYDINTLFSQSGTSAACDLNDAGLVVGRLGSVSSGTGRVWNIPALTVTPIGTFGGPTSIAYSINDLSPAVVVGTAHVGDRFCPGGQTNGHHGFKLLLSGGGLVELPPLGTDNHSDAYSVNTVLPPDLPRVVGSSDVCGAGITCFGLRDAA